MTSFPLRRTVVFFLVLLFGTLSLAGCATSASNPAADHYAEQQAAPVFLYDSAELTAAKPWTSKDFRNDPRDFQFAIIGDRTGGANVLGTFELAMGQLNLLQPEFVINVGDLIEGYTEDKSELGAMWDEADAMTAQLQMPFFHTPGNHDMSNAAAREVWLERFGTGYYHFRYQDVLFMVLDTEDGSRPAPPAHMKESIELYNRLQVENPEEAQRMLAEFMKDESVVAGLSKPIEFPDEQMAWVEKTLAENEDVRWTFVFSHEPCWENPSSTFKVIQELLSNRPHTWFAGHLHYYDYDNIDGVEYITMGSTGASWHHDGPGNVDMIAWVTMTDTGPQIGNIALKGLFDRRGLDPDLFGAYDRKGAE